MRTLILLGIILLAGCQTAERQESASHLGATIQKSAGFVEARTATGEWHPAGAGEALVEGGEARTGPDGQIEVELQPAGGVFTLHSNSTMQIERLGPTADYPNAVAVFRLTQGRITGDTLKLPKDAKVVVKTNGGTFQIP
jgi:hypothetical protein